MKIRLFFAIFALAAAILACGKTNTNTKLIGSGKSITTILNLKVSPASGTEDFTLEVTYRVSWVSGSAIPAINCHWLGKNNNNAGEIDPIDMAMHMGIKEPEENVRLLPFFIPPKEDGSQAGSYYAICETERGSSLGSNFFEVVKEDKGTPILTVTNSPVTYTGSPQAAVIRSAYLPDGIVPGTITNVLYNGSATVPTNAGTYAVTADFTPSDTTNYNSLTADPPGNFVIEKAAPSLTLSNSPLTYDGSPHAAAVSASVPGAVSSVLTGGAANQTNAGSYAVTADFAPSDTTNYNSLTAAPAGDFVIQEAAPKAFMGKFGFDFGSIHDVDPSYEMWTMVESMCSPGKGPDILISEDGKISNTTCLEGTNPPPHTGVSTFTYKVDGTMDSSGNMRFTFDIYQYGEKDSGGVSDGVWHATMDGKGKFTSPTQASGTASFTYSCDNKSFWADVSSACGVDPYRAHYGFSGEIPWTFEGAPH